MDERDEQDVSGLRPTRGEQAATGIAVALNAVPVAGGVLSGLASELIERRQNRRFQAFLEGIVNDLGAVEARLNRDFLQTEEFADLAEDAFSKAAETRQREKLDAFRAIFVNTVLLDAPRYDQAAEVLNLIERWEARHVVLLKILASPRQADAEMGNPVGPGGGFSTSIQSILERLVPAWSEGEIERTWNDLYDVRIHRTSGTKTMMTDRGISQLEGRLTDFGTFVARMIATPVATTG